MTEKVNKKYKPKKGSVKSESTVSTRSFSKGPSIGDRSKCKSQARTFCAILATVLLLIASAVYIISKKSVSRTFSKYSKYEYNLRHNHFLPLRKPFYN